MFQKNKLLKSLSLFAFIITTNTYADESFASPQDLARKLRLTPASKAIIQWERVFTSKQKLKRYKIDTLNKEEQTLLKEYLINHAIDSDQPTVAGV